MDIAEFRDLLLQAQTEAQEMVEEAIEDWYAPDTRLEVAMKAYALHAQMPEAFEFIDDRVKRKIEEVI